MKTPKPSLEIVAPNLVDDMGGVYQILADREDIRGLIGTIDTAQAESINTAVSEILNALRMMNAPCAYVVAMALTAEIGLRVAALRVARNSCVVTDDSVSWRHKYASILFCEDSKGHVSWHLPDCEPSEARTLALETMRLLEMSLDKFPGKRGS